MSEADKIASPNIGSMETTADDRLSSDPAYLTSRVIHDVACIAIDALADEAEACALFEEAGGE